MDFATCFKLGRALRYGDAESFFGVYDALLEKTAGAALSEDQLQYLKELTREISDLSREDFSLVQTAAQSHPTGSTQAHVFNLTAASNNTSDGSSNSSSSAAATKTSTPGGRFAAAAQLREVLDRLRQEVYYSDSGAVSDLDSSVCDESRRSSLVCVDTDAACVAIPSATSTAAEREAVESSRGDSELERDASSTRPKISQNQTEACQQIPETATENTRLEDSTSTERLQEPSQADADLCALQICELHTAVAGPNSEGVLANRQKFRDPGDASLIEERRASSGSHFSQQKPRSRRQSKGRKGRRRNQHQSVHTEDRSTMNHSLHRLQHDRDCKPGSSKRDERKDAGIPALASHEPSAHGQHRPSTTDSIATQLCTRAENTQVQFNTAFNYQEVVQFLQKEWVKVQNELRV